MSRQKRVVYSLIIILALVLFIVTCAKVSFEDPFIGPNAENVPVISLLGPNPYYLNVNEVYEEAGYTAYDSTDGDLTDLVVVKDNTFSTASAGQYAVKYYVTDKKNVTGFTKRTVYVKQPQGDTEKPVLTLIGLNPRRVYVGDAFVDDGATAWDNIDGDLTGSIMTYGAVISTAVPDTFTIWYMVVDNAGNVGNAKRYVYVLNGSDVDKPVIAILGNNPASIIVNQSYTDMGATAYDEVDGDLTSQIQVDNKVDTSNVAIYEVTYTVKDKANNVGEAIRYVKVLAKPDIVPPVITLLGANPLTMAVNEGFPEPGYTAYDSIDGDITKRVDVNDDMLDKSKLGSYPVKNNVKDAAGNAAEEKIRTVNVVDTIGPVITIKGPKTVNLSVGFSYTEYGATAFDNYDGDLTWKIDTAGDTVNTSVPKTYYVHYTVSDASGNSSDSVRNVIVGDVPDLTPPVITLKGSNPMSLVVGGTYTEPGATAMDNKDGDISSKIVITGTVNTSVAGTYQVKYNVTDIAGNKAVEKIRTVYVGVTGKDSVIIGTGTVQDVNLPVCPDYSYSYTQSIYLQSEIAVGRTITIDSVAFEYNGDTAWTDNILVYLGHTTKTAFATTTDWVTVTSMTQVYSGNFTVPATRRWIKIKFTTPFQFNTSSNLVVAIKKSSTVWHGAFAAFYCTSAAGYRSLYYRNDTTNPNPSSPPTATNRKTNRPNIRIYYR